MPSHEGAYPDFSFVLFGSAPQRLEEKARREETIAHAALEPAFFCVHFVYLLKFHHCHFERRVADILRQVLSGIRPNRVVGVQVVILTCRRAE